MTEAGPAPILRPGACTELVSRTILVAGSARSGTTIMGKLISSLKGVEYLYEPPMLVVLLNAMHRLPAGTFREMFEYFLYEDFLLDALAGRRLNLNRNDDSSVWNVKSEAEVEHRFSRSFRRVELEDIAHESTIAFKTPEAVFHVEKLKALYPDMRILLMHRNPNDVLNSLIGKAWFSDEALDAAGPVQIYPVRIRDNRKIPYWVDPGDDAFWVGATELDRSAYYYCGITENILKNRASCHVIDYDRFVKEPASVLDDMRRLTGLDEGPRTPEILASVSYPEKKREDLLSRVESDLRERIEAALKGLET